MKIIACCNQKVINDIHLASCFTILFTAFNTQSHIQKILTVSITQENPSYYADGYVSFGIIYTFLACAVWLSPSIIAMMGWKVSLTVGAFCYLSFVTFMYFEIGWLTYLSSAITGFGGALLWTAQANYVVLNSESGDVYQGIGLFWMVYQISYVAGNIVVYFLFNDPKKPINKRMRGEITIILLCFVLIAIIMLMFLRQPIRKDNENKEIQTPLNAFKKSYSIFKSKYMLISSVTFMYCGINLTFMSVLAASLGFTKYLSSNSRQFAPLSGVLQGFGEIAGCGLALFIKEKKIFSLSFIMLTACLANIIGYIVIFLGLPNNSALTYTDEDPIVRVTIYPLLATNILIGISDACQHIEIYNYLGNLYPNNSASAFAVFKFFRCIAAAGSFYYSNCIGLHLQLLISIAMSILGFIAYQYATNTLKPKEIEENEMPAQSNSSSQYYQSD